MPKSKKLNRLPYPQFIGLFLKSSSQRAVTHQDELRLWVFGEDEGHRPDQGFRSFVGNHAGNEKDHLPRVTLSRIRGKDTGINAVGNDSQLSQVTINSTGMISDGIGYGNNMVTSLDNEAPNC